MKDGESTVQTNASVRNASIGASTFLILDFNFVCCVSCETLHLWNSIAPTEICSDEWLVVNISGASNKASILTGFIPKIWHYLAIGLQVLDQTLCQVAWCFSRKSSCLRQKRSRPLKKRKKKWHGMCKWCGLVQLPKYNFVRLFVRNRLNETGRILNHAIMWPQQSFFAIILFYKSLFFR